IVLSSVPALPLMAGKILGLGAAGLTQVVFWVLSVLVVSTMLGDGGGSLEAISIAPIAVILGLVYFALGYLGYGAIFSAVGALAPGSREAQQYAGFFGFFAVVPLIFSSVFLTDIGSPIVTILALIPFTTPAAMLMVVTLAPEIPWGLVAVSMASLVAFTVLATIASARVFRATLLLYGVRPSARSIVGAILARA
ncbi:MAG: ABC transporter permease, partial [Chloroflexota bacterium]|nr:ABC transporter permease [Chloroflexota bacterium]